MNDTNLMYVEDDDTMYFMPGRHWNIEATGEPNVVLLTVSPQHDGGPTLKLVSTPRQMLGLLDTLRECEAALKSILPTDRPAEPPDGLH